MPGAVLVFLAIFGAGYSAQATNEFASVVPASEVDAWRQNLPEGLAEADLFGQLRGIKTSEGTINYYGRMGRYITVSRPPYVQSVTIFVGPEFEPVGIIRDFSGGHFEASVGHYEPETGRCLRLATSNGFGGHIVCDDQNVTVTDGQAPTLLDAG